MPPYPRRIPSPPRRLRAGDLTLERVNRGVGNTAVNVAVCFTREEVGTVLAVTKLVGRGLIDRQTDCSCRRIGASETVDCFRRNPPVLFDVPLVLLV